MTFHKHMPQGMKSAIVYTFASLCSKGLAIITVPIFTRLMTTEEIGTVNLYNSWHAMIAAVATLSLTSGGYMVALKEFEKERDQYQSSVLTLTSLVSCLLFLVYSIAPGFWSRVLGLDQALILLLLIGFLFSPATEFWLARQRYEYRYKAAAVITIGSAVLASALSVLVILYLHKQGSHYVAQGRLFANYSILYGVACVLWFMIMLRGRTFISMRFWKFSLALSLPLIANSLATQVLNTSDRLMISKLVNNAAVGIYGTLSSISSISAIVWGAINTSFIPFLYKNIENDKGKVEIKHLAKVLLGFYAVVCVLITFAAPEIVQILATKEYYAAIFIMPPIAAGIFQNAISNMYSNVLLYHKRSVYILIATVIAAVVNVVLNAIFIPINYMAAAYTTLFAHVVLAELQMYTARKMHFKVTKTKETVYDDKGIIAIQVAAILVCIMAIPLYQFTLLRYAVIGLIGIGTLFLYRKFKLKSR